MLDDVRRALVVAAHPDGLETIMGGTTAMLTDRGVEIVEVVLTSGDIGASGEIPHGVTRGTLAAVREEETRAAAADLGVRDVVFLHRPDGEVVADLHLRADIARLYRRYQPDSVFTFDPWWPGQAHPDHAAAGRAALDAYMPSKMPLYHPEQLRDGVAVAQIKHVFLFGGTTREDFVVDVTPYWDRKVQATLRHRSQFPDPEQPLEWLRKWSGEAGARISVPYGETFARMDVW